MSTIDSLFIEWSEGATGDIEILGYRLYMIEKGTGESNLIYDGSFNPLTKRYWAQGLQTGQYYAFYVVAIDFNSESEPSDETVAVVCVLPGHLESPQLVSTETGSILLEWSMPYETGGCPILGYELYMSSDDQVSYSLVDELEIANKPYLTGHTVTGFSTLGEAYWFKLRAINEIGYSESLAKEIVYALTPSKPASSPAQDFVLTSKSHIKLLYDAIEGTDTGGSPILGYDLWRDDGQNGDYSQLYATESILSLSYVDTDVEPSKLYRYIYRARNINGYGLFSDPGYMYAASVPSRPEAPTLIAVASDSITVLMHSPVDTGGADIDEYVLLMDEGVINTEFT